MAKHPQVEAFFRAQLEEQPRGAQRQMAQAIGASEPTVSRWVRGDAVPDKNWWRPLADHLGIPYTEVRAALTTGDDAAELHEMVQRLLAEAEGNSLTLAEVLRALTAIETMLQSGQSRRGAAPLPGPVR